MEFVPYAGWQRCARIVSGDVEALVTTEVGPRVIRLGFMGKENELHENPDEVGMTGGNEYRSYGGHRLWYAPEDKVETYTPENEPIDAVQESGWWVFTPKPNRFGMQKQIRIKPTGEGGFQLDHRITNHGSPTPCIAPWSLTVMKTGGTCIIPQHPYAPFPEVLTPVRPLVMWSYTDLADPRFTFSKHLIKLAQDTNSGPVKIGSFVSQGYAAYLNGDRLFIKRFGAEEEETYPDMGCNFETFTRQDTLEIESLGPMIDLAPGQTVRHLEDWRLYGGVSMSKNDEEAATMLTRLSAW